MSSRLPFGNNTLVIPFTMPLTRPARRGGGMSRNKDPSALYPYGTAPPTVSANGERSYAPIPRQSRPEVTVAKALPAPTRVQSASPAGTANASDTQATPAGAPTPAQAAEPEHDRVWWWLHDQGLANTRHENAEMLRRSLGRSGGLVLSRDGIPVEVDQMSDEEVLALDREVRGNIKILPPMVGAPTKPPLTQ